MILTAREYADRYPQKNELVGEKTIKRRCIENNLPSGHRPLKKGNTWLIEIPDCCSDCSYFRPSHVFNDQGRCDFCKPSITVMRWMSCFYFDRMITGI